MQLNIGSGKMLDYYAYYSVNRKRKFAFEHNRKGISLDEIKRQLSKSVLNELLHAPHTVCIESNKSDAIKYLDEFLVKKRGFGRDHCIEVIENEISNYNYYFVDLESFSWGMQVFYDIQKPTCSHETCPWGFKITSPIEISDKIVGTFDIARAFSIWDLTIKFIVSARIKRLFDEKEVTGLKYSTCSVRNNDKQLKQTDNMDTVYYVAEITSSYCRNAKSVNIRDYCKKHSIALDCQGVNLTYPIQSMTSKDDFQMIDKLAVGKKVYNIRPWFFLSRRVLRMLINTNARALKTMALFTKNGFTPVPFD